MFQYDFHTIACLFCIVYLQILGKINIPHNHQYTAARTFHFAIISKLFHTSLVFVISKTCAKRFSIKADVYEIFNNMLKANIIIFNVRMS